VMGNLRFAILHSLQSMLARIENVGVYINIDISYLTLENGLVVFLITWS